MTDERDAAGKPLGRDRLVLDLRSLGVRPGHDLLVHCSMRRVGMVSGGAATLLAAILEVAGPESTVVVPTHTAWNSFTSRTFREATAGLAPDDYVRYVAAMPGFQPECTPSAGMGALAEYVRTRPGARRSLHPQTSFAAIGPRAAQAMSVHDVDCHLGERSPLGWLYTADATILLIGVGYSACTAFHLAEYRSLVMPPLREYRCFTTSEGKRVVRQFTDIDLDDSDFHLIGASLDAATWPDTDKASRHGHVGLASSTLLPMRTAVDFACRSMARRRMNTVQYVRG